VETRLKSSVAAILGSVGGQMGLWLGVSVITVEHMLLSLGSALWQRLQR